LIAVADLGAAARALEARHGLASVEGGRHPGWGTANRIVPLGDTYIELIAVADEAEAAGSAFGSWVARARSAPARPLGWAVRTDRLDDVARRLEVTVSHHSRSAAGGQTLRWRLAGIEQAATEPSLPFFIEWAPNTPFPGRAEAAHPARAVRITELQLQGDGDRLAAWLGPHDLPITVRTGAPAVGGIVLAAGTEEILLDANPL
jgi:hypothetical protein